MGMDRSLIPKLEDGVIKYWINNPLTDDVYWNMAIEEEAKQRGIKADWSIDVD
ncbi:MAG: hypothetical protein KAS32_26270 [Candidatus Peribacteraceae bacterium]|nr:hypothetical protein [Candidatus Peribacteraceae bacterium]